MSRLPSLKAIQVFEVVARHLSFSRAADELCVSQSAVSHQIRALENHLGKQLFIRANNAVFLSSYGEIYYSGISESFKLLHSTTNKVIETNDITLNIVAQSSLASEWLAPRIALFKKQNPEVTLKLSMVSNPDQYDPSEFHVSIGTWSTPTDFSTKPLRAENWYPVFTGDLDSELDLDDPCSIVELPLISSQNGSDWDLWMRNQKIEGFKETDFLYVNDPLLAAKAAQSGEGVALSCDFIVADAIKSNCLKAAKKHSFSPYWGQYFVHYLSGSRYIDLFVKWILNESKSE